MAEQPELKDADSSRLIIKVDGDESNMVPLALSLLAGLTVESHIRTIKGLVCEALELAEHHWIARTTPLSMPLFVETL